MQTNKAYSYQPSLRVVKKTCQYCGNQITNGRADKKYCDRNCQNAYNNELNSAANNNIRNVNNALGKNRRVLQSFIAGKENIKVTKKELLSAGFQFDLHTNSKANKQGRIYYYCYEFGYLSLDEDLFLIVRGKG